MFWAMTLAVFVQFFTRYVLNNSLAWTEEVAINFLVGVVFGSIMCVRLSHHIQVDVLYHYIPPRSPARSPCWSMSSASSSSAMRRIWSGNTPT